VPVPPPRKLSTTLTSDAAAVSAARYLVVLGEARLQTVPLPAQGELVLGRDPDCDVRLDHARISRRHVKLVIGRDIAVEDLGSKNGITVGGARLERGVPALLPLGEALRLGPFTVVVLAGAPSGADAPGALTVPDPTPAGRSPLLERIATAGVNVLIQGETGTGKEVLARTLHALSGRPGEIVAINCAALSGTLLESELFGHERGAFTGAVRAKPGLLEVAGRGTVLLDEIGELPLELQAKLLRVLESRQLYRVGGIEPIAVEARLIAATHRDLPAAVEAGRFRQDLYFRINGITLTVPPLRARPDAIVPLAAGFLAPGARLTPAAAAALVAHRWPGNVRELRLGVERAALLASGAPIDAAHLVLDASSPAADADRFAALARKHRGNVSAIARALDTSRSQVHRLAERHRVDLAALRG
jgi:hypothetical protein